VIAWRNFKKILLDFAHPIRLKAYSLLFLY
jgi:hypothetical protein